MPLAPRHYKYNDLLFSFSISQHSVAYSVGYSSSRRPPGRRPGFTHEDQPVRTFLLATVACAALAVGHVLTPGALDLATT